MKAQKGQSFVETAVGMGILAVMALILWAVFWNAYGDQITANAAKGSSEIAASLYLPTAIPSIVLEASHALENHPEDAKDAYACMAKHGVYQQWVNFKNHRKANVCFEGLNFFIQILEGNGEEVTAFKRTQAKSLGDVGNYLKDGGYVK